MDSVTRAVAGVGRLLPLLALASVAANPQPLITTIAGVDRPLPQSGQPALQAPLIQPQSLALDSQGRLYIADAQRHMVLRVNLDKSIAIVAGSGIQGFSGDGELATRASLNTPSGIAADSVGNLYIADENNHRIRKVTPDGTISTFAGGVSPGFAGDGGPAVNAQLLYPYAVAADGSGALYIADSLNHRIRKVTPDGTITTLAGTGTPGFAGDGGPAASSNLNTPHGVALDASNNLYISDTKNSRIRKIAQDGTITTVSGSGVEGFSGDGGPAISAALDNPHGIFVDSSGTLYIADLGNNRFGRYHPVASSPRSLGPAFKAFQAMAAPPKTRLWIFHFSWPRMRPAACL